MKPTEEWIDRGAEVRARVRDRSSLILEVGCGTTSSEFDLEKSRKPGKYRIMFSPKVEGENVIYVDLTRPKFTIPRFIIADAQMLPFREKVFKDVYASHLIEHLQEPGKFLREAKRTSTGKICLWCPNVLSWGATKRIDPTHIHIFSYFKLRGLLIKAGYDIIENADYKPANRLPKPIARMLHLIVFSTSNELHLEGRS